MSARRSRLKAVTNLPVRRKTLTSQGNANEATSAENLTSEKVYSCDLKASDVTCQATDVLNENQTALSNANDTPSKNTEPIVYLNSACDLQNSENTVTEVALIRINESDGAQVSESVDENRTSINCRTDEEIGSVFKSGKRFKPNLILSTVRERIHVQTPDRSEEFEILDIFRPTPQFIGNDIGNYETVTETETETAEPVLTDLTCRNNEEEISNTYTNVNSSFIEVGSPEDLVPKPVTKNKIISNKANFSGDDEHYRKSTSQRQDIDMSEYALSLNISPNLHPFKKHRSTVRNKRSKCNDYTKKLADAKKEFQKKYENSKPDRSTLKMIDLIFYNPGTNPMESKIKFEKIDTSGFTQVSEAVQDSLAEERVDEPEALDSNSVSNVSDSCETENMNKMPVPQVKIGLDGEIILDEKSLVIETTDAKKGREGLQNSTPIFEDREYKGSYYRGRCKKPRDWSDFETKRFYKALNTIGPDFTLMQKFFPTRSRLELKNKFKREERLNRNLIDKALNNPSEFDMTQLEQDLAVEREAEEEIKMGKKKRRKKPRIKKSSFLSREMVDSEEESESDSDDSKVNYSNSKRLSEDEKNKKEKEFDFVFQKLLMKESQMTCSALPQIPSSPNTFEYSNQGVT